MAMSHPVAAPKAPVPPPAVAPPMTVAPIRHRQGESTDCQAANQERAYLGQGGSLFGKEVICLRTSFFV